MIRKAELADVPTIASMVSKDINEGYASLITPNESHIARMLAILVESPDGYVMVAEEGELIGMIGALKHAHVVSGEIGVGELFMWVHPDHRHGQGPGLFLVRGLTRWAKETGAKWIQMSCPAGKDDLEKCYIAMGYSKVETQYQRRLD